MLSPHLDDAVLSVGGLVAAWAEEGRVDVVSVYSAGPPLDTVPADMRQFADYATRCREDAAAVAALGAQHVWLGHTEHAFRGRRLTLGEVFATPRARDGFSERAAIVRSLDTLLEPSAGPLPDRVAVPLGIGNHVDHVEALIAATDWLLARGLADRAVFYEDFYALSEPMRRAHWLAARHRWDETHAPLRRAPRLAAMLDEVAAVRSGPPVDALLAAPWRDAEWRVERAPLGRHAARKRAAIACYASQTRAFGGLGGIIRALAAYHAWWGDAEPLWRCDAG